MADSDLTLRVFTIAPGAPFLDTLARAVLDGSLVHGNAAPSPLELSGTEILLPSRRAARSLATVFPAHVSGAALLLPRISTLGDIDEDPEVQITAGGALSPEIVSDLERQIVLADISQAWAANPPPDWPVSQNDPVPRNAGEAAAFAADLGRLIDALEVEEIGASGLAGVLPEDCSHLAQNWAVNLGFLTHAIAKWDDHLKTRRLVSRMAHRSAEADRLTAELLAKGSGKPMIAAGSTGSVPATARLLRAIAGLPNGAVVLPGLDLELDAESWEKLGPDHPQYGLKALLGDFGMARDEVGVLGASPKQISARARLQSEVMRPAESADKWIERLDRFEAAEARSALDQISEVVAADAFEEARVIAMIMRAAIEKPNRTVALVTPDRHLVRRVRSELWRWQIEVDESAGDPLDTTAHGIFVRLLIDAVVSGFSPVPTLGLLKHPLTRLGMPPAEIRNAARIVELVALRGGRPGRGLAGLTAIFEAKGNSPSRHPVLRRIGKADIAAGKALLDKLSAATGPLTALIETNAAARGNTVAAVDLVRRLIETAEAVAAIADDEPTPLWRGETGEALAGFLADLSEAAHHGAAIETASFAGWMGQLMAGQVVRRPGRGHKRLAIWGLLEARLQQADTVILAGLNEGVWPSETQTNPWLGRNMLSAMGLTLPERKIGLAAHDFSQGFLAPQVILTRSEKSGGAPGVPSRWLWRLQAVKKGLGISDATQTAEPWLSWARGLDPAPAVKPDSPPLPTPPVIARPTSLSVTAIETWIRDPYAIYAKHILGLAPLEPIDSAPDARDYGTMVHGALAQLLGKYPVAPLPETALAELLEFGAQEFAGLALRPGIAAYWWMRFERIARWFVNEDEALRDAGTSSACEVKGRLEIRVAGLDQPFTLTARADRIDGCEDGSSQIVDYKTGSLPGAKEIEKLLAPQMPLEAAILAAGGFEGHGRPKLSALNYIQLKGRNPVGTLMNLAGDPFDLAQAAMEKLSRLIAAYADPQTPYRARVAIKHEDYAGDYDHLARVKEWSQSTRRRRG